MPWTKMPARAWEDEIVRLFPWLVDWDATDQLCPKLQGIDVDTAIGVLRDEGEVKPAEWLAHWKARVAVRHLPERHEEGVSYAVEY